MMDGLKAVKVAELRNKLTAIPAKIILTIVITGLFFWETDFDTTLECMKGDLVYTAKMLIILYGIISYIHFFVRLFHSYIVGLIVAAAAAFAVYSIRGKFTDTQFLMIELFMIFGGPICDALRFLRYMHLKREVIEESRSLRDRIDDIYDNVHGYEEGYERGYESGYYRGRNEGISYDDRDRIGDYGREDEYDDGYDDGYEDEYVEERRSSAALPGGFFEGCRTPEAIKKRYRDLCKVYHPDSGNGSEIIFEAICDEYNSLMDE